jgi:hypothetical protein
MVKSTDSMVASLQSWDSMAAVRSLERDVVAAPPPAAREARRAGPASAISCRGQLPPTVESMRIAPTAIYVGRAAAPPWQSRLFLDLPCIYGGTMCGGACDQSPFRGSLQARIERCESHVK